MDAFCAGWVEVPNPFRPTQVSRISLRPEDIDAMFFWTRDIRPLLPHLDRTPLASIRSVFLYTITGYGPALEPGIPELDVATAALRALAARVGSARVIWRYDPIIIGDGPLAPEAHLTRFRSIAARLEGATSRVVLSLIDWYRKTIRGMRTHLDGRAAPRADELEPTDPAVLDLVRELGAVAGRHGITATGCCEPEWQTRGVLSGGACIDSELLRQIWDLDLPMRRDQGQRDACRCIPARDIGRYDTCNGGCRYCYATLAKRREKN